MQHARRTATLGGGFTLVEILIVVVILGIISAITVPQMANAGQDTEKAVFVADIKTFAEAADIFRARTGTYLEDSSTGQVPAGFESYIDTRVWQKTTPIGGSWDAEFNSMSIRSAIGVHFDGSGQTRDDAYMASVDLIFDDGDVTTGAFRRLAAGRYYYVLAEEP